MAFVAQSGGLSEDFARAAPNFGFYCSKVVSYGNACDVNEADLLEYAGLDPATNVVGMYIEGPRDGRRFARVLREVAARKPVVVWKGGMTPLGAAAASSHTGSLAGSVEVWSALLAAGRRRAGGQFRGTARHAGCVPLPAGVVRSAHRLRGRGRRKHRGRR